MGKGFFSWIQPVHFLKEVELVNTIGMDATVFLRFLRMLRNMFACLTVIGCGVLIPLNIIGGRALTSQYAGISMFQKFTPMYIFGTKFWAYVIVAYAFNIIICVFLWLNYRAVVKLRRTYFESTDYLNSLHSRTLLVC